MKQIIKEIPKSLLVGFLCLVAALSFVSVWRLRELSVPVSGQELHAGPYTYVLDAGHGGEDGGATTADGVKESGINLAISLKLDALLHLLGQHTVMVRRDDRAVYDPGSETFSQKKVSDLRNRVRLVEQTENAFLISIHQNEFSQAKYSGAQVFYNEIPPAKAFAKRLQSELAEKLDPENHRKSKSATDTVYLMRQIHAPGLLVECGFLSNPQEAERLQQDDYQTKLALVVACSVTASVQEEMQSNESKDNIPVYKLRQ